MTSSDATLRPANRPGWKKLPARYNAVVLPLFLSVLMTCIVSAISTLTGVGFSEGVLAKWLEAWAISWLIAFPTLLFVLPIVRRLVATLVEQPGR